MIEKYYNENGEVAVIYSPGFGAGWYTWNSLKDCNGADPRELIFDKTLVEMILASKSIKELEKYVVEKWGGGVYCGGLGDCKVTFFPEGTEFVIEEYDGSESITTRVDTNWIIT